MTTVYLRHIARDLLDVHQRVELVSQHHSFLLINFLAVSCNAHVEIASAYLAGAGSALLLTPLARIATLLLVLRLLTMLLTCWQHFDAGCSTLDGLSIDLDGCCRHLESPFRSGYNGISKGYRTALGCAAVHNRDVARSTGAGTIKNVEALEVADLEIFDVLRVGHIADADSLAYFGLGRSLDFKRNLRKDRT